MNINFDAFTDEAQKVARQVFEIASRYNQSHLDIDHVFLALFEVPGGELNQIYNLLDIKKEPIQRKLEFIVSRRPRGDGIQVKTRQFTIDQRMKTVIEQAQYEANRLWVKDIKPVHLLIAAVKVLVEIEKNSACGKIVAETSLTPDRIRKVVMKLANTSYQSP